MDVYGRQPLIVDRGRDHAKVDQILHNRLHDFGPLQPCDLHGHNGVELLELGEYLRQYMQASPLVRTYHDLTPGHSLHLSYRYQEGFAGFERLLGILLKDLACGGESYLTPAAVKQLGADLLFQSAYLGGNGRLRAKTLVRSPGEAAVP